MGQIRDLILIMIEMSHEQRYQWLWYREPMPKPLRQPSSDILWTILRRLSQQYLKIVPIGAEAPLLSFDELKDVHAYTGAVSEGKEVE